MLRRPCAKALSGIAVYKKIDASSYATDKGSHLNFLPYYEKWFQPLLSRDIKFLELGIDKGGSLLLWRDYFETGIIVGLDVNPVAIEDPTGRIRTYQGRQEDTVLLDRIAREQAPEGFDVIIDDCSHIGALTRASFWHLFPHHLKPGGMYIIEDIGTGYMDNWPDGKAYEPRRPAVNRFRPRLWFTDPVTSDGHFISLVRGLSSRLLAKALRSSGFARKTGTPSHLYGMIGFAKEVVDYACLGVLLPDNPVKEVHFSQNLMMVVKRS
ncbi:MAG: class I SAM-dependent methyltransferase [Dehalococcoidia bacterium]|nr:class I SAM-dependent methyltransferase [Dehalococcoidia bacterium]